MHALLRMTAGYHTLALPIQEVREIQQVARLTPVPRSPDFVRGVMNLRGAVVPVIDLAARLGQPPATLNRRSCIVVVGAPTQGDAESSNARQTMGLLVDAVYEVFERPDEAIEPVPALGGRIEPRLLAGITRADGQLVGVLALNQLLDPQDLTHQIAEHQLA